MSLLGRNPFPQPVPSLTSHDVFFPIREEVPGEMVRGSAALHTFLSVVDTEAAASVGDNLAVGVEE